MSYPKQKEMIVIRAADGEVINIGPWDFKAQPIPGSGKPLTLEDGSVRLLPDGRPMIDPATIEWEAGNPMPPGAYEDRALVEIYEDGSRAVIGPVP